LHNVCGMPQLLASRFVATGPRWMDLASGAAVRIRIAEAGTQREQFEWNSRCAALANLRHPLMNPLIDYGMADAHRTFEAYEPAHPVDVGRATGAGQHVIRFLRAHGVVLEHALADYVLRPIRAATGRRAVSLGFALQPRQAFGAIQEALETAFPAGATAIAVTGEPHSGLRTLRLGAARTARLEGFVPLAASVVRHCAWIARSVVDRHVCVLCGDVPGEPEAVASLLSRLGSTSARRHVVLRFGRGTRRGPVVLVERMGIMAMTQMVFVDAECGPSADELFASARKAHGRPGEFLALLGACARRGDRQHSMAVHESVQPYELLDRHPAPAPLGRRRGLPGALHRAPERGEALARAGRHGAAARLLRRALRVLAAREEHDEAARCALQIGWLSLERGLPAAAAESFENARALSTTGVTAVRAGLGTGIAWTDDGRLVEAEAALRAASLGAQALDDLELAAQARTGLARCLLWQGRYDEAAAVLRVASDTCLGAREQARASVTLARVLIAEKASTAAVRTARMAVGHSTAAGNPQVRASALRALAEAVAAAGECNAAADHLRTGLEIARAAHLPLETARLRLAGLRIQAQDGSRSAEHRRAAARLAGASGRWPGLLRFYARAVCAQVEGADIDAPTRAFIEASGAAAITHMVSTPSSNPVAELEAFLALGQTAPDDRAAVDRIVEQLRSRLRAATVVVIGPEPERRTIAISGRPWSGEPHAAWRVIATGLAVAAQAAIEPCEAAEPLRYSGEVIGSVAARWIAGSIIDPGRAGSLLRVGGLAMAASVRALLDTSVFAAVTYGPGEEILGESAPAKSMRESIARAARAPYPVLIEGESGSGKELVARAIHRLGPRRDRRFCAINCAALSDELLEAELFGHARGAFTGAVGDRAGLFEEADGGTLFLDEIGELSARAQAKLLRVLQDGQVRRVGENVSRRVDVRIVAATNRRLAHEAEAGRFRADLRFRLDVVRIEVPPLRDRAGDVPLLASSFWTDAAARMGSRATLSPDTLAALARYDWPGNVRELQNVIAWMAVHSPSRGRITAAAVPAHVAQAGAIAGSSFEAARSDFERRFVKAALATSSGHRARAAQALGVTRQGLAKMLRRLRIEGGP
jgi:DNA-binding NtrC family response regulator/tetratricopeptide (TPR) repeat protein